MGKVLFFSFWNCMFFLYAGGQVKLAGEGRYQRQPGDYITSQQKETSYTTHRNATATTSFSANRIAAGTLQWPLKQATGFNDNGYYSITGYIDHNAASDADPIVNNHVTDYNCGNRSWDIDGWNHDGTDVTIWPFPWTKMQNNAVEVISMEAGYIRKKVWTNADQSCQVASCTGCEWNGIIIEHDDGTAARYIHLKKNSLTSKAVGQRVDKGEFLGIVGSSGRSYRPHLHFDLWQTYAGADAQIESQLIDPWNGSCNTATSLWANQEDYYVPAINTVMTHSDVPVPDGCSDQEAMNAKSVFAAGETVYTGAYYRDNQLNQTATHTIYKPDNTVFQTWDQTFSSTDEYSWVSYSFTLPSTNADGTWKYEVAYNSQTVFTNFIVTGTGAVLPLQLLSFTGKRQNEEILLEWTTENEIQINRFEVQRSIDGVNYENIAATNARNISTKQLYSFVDPSPLRANNFYRLKIVDQDGSIEYSPVVKIDNKDATLRLEASPNPFGNRLAVNVAGESRKLDFHVLSITGQRMLSKTVTNIRGQIIYLNTGHLPAGVYLLSVYEDNRLIHYKKIIKK